MDMAIPAKTVSSGRGSAYGAATNIQRLVELIEISPPNGRIGGIRLQTIAERVITDVDLSPKAALSKRGSGCGTGSNIQQWAEAIGIFTPKG
jgi:hypothetical protein